MTPDELLAAWHQQQTAFIELREQRTRAITDVLVALHTELGRPLRVLDLGCGPASLATATLERLPDSQLVGVDRDPVLLRLARETNRFGDQMLLVDADLTSPELADQIPPGPYDAAISATALHWLDPDQLAGLYLRVGTLLGPSAIFMNADHLYFDQIHEPALAEVAQSERERVRLALLASGAMTWDDWWQAAFKMPGWQAEAELWQTRWAAKHTTVPASLEFHLAALRAAGFTEVAQIYQWFDDRVIFGKKPLASETDPS